MEDGGTFTDLSAAPNMTLPVVTEILPQKSAEEESTSTSARLAPTNFRFVEFFAGEGQLTAAVARAGVPTDPGNDLNYGGFDFGKEQDVEKAKAYLTDLAVNGVRLMVHVAPPARRSQGRATEAGRRGCVRPSARKDWLDAERSARRRTSSRGTP